MLKVAVIGRPNVGKSTLFNALVGKNIAIVKDVAGVTRDRKYANANLFDIYFTIIDTAGFEINNKDLNVEMVEQSVLAIDEADIVLFMVDARDGLLELDKDLAHLIRTSNKPCAVLLNKTDTFKAKENLYSFYELGFNTNINISATHRIGLEEVYNFIVEQANNMNIDISKPEDNKPDLMLAFVGRPNVGKSSIINKLLGSNQLITSNIAGTTRDSIYINLNYKDKLVKLVDTAGLRKKGKVEKDLEKFSNSETITAINFANVVVVVLSAEEPLSKQDLTIAHHVHNEGRGLLFVVNKIDKIENKALFIKQIEQGIIDSFYQIKKPYVITTSALTEENLTKILDSAIDVYHKWQFSISTSRLNTWLQSALDKTQPPTVNGRRIKIKYATQTKHRPPTISLWVNMAQKFPDSYLRYLQNEFFKSFNLWGCSIRFELKQSNNPYVKNK